MFGGMGTIKFMVSLLIYIDFILLQKDLAVNVTTVQQGLMVGYVTDGVGQS